MKTTAYLEIGTPVALAACAWLLNSSIDAGAAHHKKPTNRVVAAEPEVPQMAPVLATRRRVMPGEGKNAEGAISPHTDAFGQFDRLVLTPEPGGVTIEGAATIYDRRPWKKPLMGTVLVRDPTTGRILRALHDDRQVFSVPAGETIRPTFRDMCQLPPGTYHVDLRLYEAGPGIVPEVLDQAINPHGSILLSRRETITAGR